jgi:hypothetical protein
LEIHGAVARLAPSSESIPAMGQKGKVQGLQAQTHRATYTPLPTAQLPKFGHLPNAWQILAMAVILGAKLNGAAGLKAQDLKTDSTLAPVTQKSSSVPRFTLRDRIRFYDRTTFSPSALVGPLAGAAWTQGVSGNPPEWGQGFAGYGRRVLSGYSRQVIANTVGFGVALATHEDPRHYLTGEHAFWKRSLYSAREAVVSHNTSGGLMPAYSRIVGAYAAGFISNAWYPAPYSNVHSALYRGSTALASDVIWQEFKEFWPDVRRKLRLR